MIAFNQFTAVMAAEQEAEQSIQEAQNAIVANLAAARTLQQQLLSAERSKLESDMHSAVTAQQESIKGQVAEIANEFEVQAKKVEQSFLNKREKLLVLIKQQL
jgi:hypothetical protein